jgi:hypothetical protein
MRGIVAAVLKGPVILAGLGAILVAAAVIWPNYVIGQFLKIPAKEDVSSSLLATNATVFSPKTLSVRTGVTLQITATIKTDPKHPGNSSMDVWDESSVIQDVTDHVTIATASRILAFNRSTLQLIPCCGESLNGDTSTKQTGYLGALFPMNVKKQTYLVFDPTLKKQMPYVYSGTVNVGGIQAYEFIENFGLTKTGTTPFLGSLVGSPAAVPTLPEYSAAHAVFYVDPETGAPLEINEHQTTIIRNPANGRSVTVIDADLVSPPALLASTVALDKSARAKLQLVKTTLPAVAGFLGTAMLIAGMILGRRRRARMVPAYAGVPGFTVPSQRHRPAGRRYRGTRRRRRGARHRTGPGSQLLTADERQPAAGSPAGQPSSRW